MKSMKISKVMEIIKPKYIYYKVTPNNSIRNHSTYKIARVVSSLYRNVFQRIKREETKLVNLLGKEFLIGTKYSFNLYEKVGYYVYVEKKRVDFYFIIPEHYSSILEERINDTWENVTVKEVDEIPQFSDKAVKYGFTYKKEDALSLKVDRRSNELLRSNLNIINVLEENEKIGIYYNFFPVNQHTWHSEYRSTIDKIKNRVPVNKNKVNMTYVLMYGLKVVTNIVESILDSFIDKKKEEKQNALEYLLNALYRKGDNLSESTIDKESSVVLGTQILLLSESDDQVKAKNNARSVGQSFETITEDNRLVMKPIKSKVNLESFKINGAPTLKTSDVECQNFISLAGRDILEDYNFIDKVETKETKVPEDLQEGAFCIGTNTFKGNEQKAYLSTDKEFKYLSLILIGPNRSGKSTLMGNLGKNAIDNNEVVINFDFIGNCELSDEMSQLFPKEMTLDIECNDFSRIQGLGYNEIEKSDDPFQQYANAKLQTTQLTTLVNSINTDDKPLTTRMERYLQSAANIVFISNGSIKDVFEVLQNHNKRHQFIRMVPTSQLENLQEYVDNLYELDDTNKDGEVEGTRFSRVDGIMDRLNKLKANPYMEQMLKRGSENNINLVDEFQKCQLINIRMPETMFSTDNEKDVYTTYWITKIWLALQVRKARYKDDRDAMKKVNLFIDELYQVVNTEKFLTTKLSRLPKFNIKPILSCHYLRQIKHIREELRSANASYMLIAGCDKDNYKELASELYPYEESDLLNLKRHYSLNLIKTKDGYGKFITKMPPPVGPESESKEIDQNIKNFEKSGLHSQNNIVYLDHGGNTP